MEDLLIFWLDVVFVIFLVIALKCFEAEKSAHLKEGISLRWNVSWPLVATTAARLEPLSSPSPLLQLLLHLTKSLLLSHFLIHLGIFSYFSFSTDRAIQFGGLSKGESSLLLSIIGVSNCLGRVLFGQLLDR